MKEKVIAHLRSLGFETVSHISSPRKIFLKDDIIVTIEERPNKK